MIIWYLERSPTAYDQYVGFVIVASDEAEARRVAFEKDPDEKYDFEWLDHNLSTCVTLGVTLHEPASRIVLGSYHAG